MESGRGHREMNAVLAALKMGGLWRTEGPGRPHLPAHGSNAQCNVVGQRSTKETLTVWGAREDYWKNRTRGGLDAHWRWPLTS